MKSIMTEQAPAPIGPFSQAIQAQNILYCSGQIGVVPGEKGVVNEDVGVQTLQVLKNIHAVLQSAGLTLTNVAKMTVFLKDMNDFAKMNEIYAEFFGDHKPARTAVEVARLPQDAKVEMECLATV